MRVGLPGGSDEEDETSDSTTESTSSSGGTGSRSTTPGLPGADEPTEASTGTSTGQEQDDVSPPSRRGGGSRGTRGDTGLDDTQDESAPSRRGGGSDGTRGDTGLDDTQDESMQPTLDRSGPPTDDAGTSVRDSLVGAGQTVLTPGVLAAETARRGVTSLRDRRRRRQRGEGVDSEQGLSDIGIGDVLGDPSGTVGTIQRGGEFIDPESIRVTAPDPSDPSQDAPVTDRRRAESLVRDVSGTPIDIASDPAAELARGPSATQIGVGGAVGRRPEEGPIGVPGPLGGTGAISRARQVPAIIRGAGEGVQRAPSRTGPTGAGDVAESVSQFARFAPDAVDSIRAGAAAGVTAAGTIASREIGVGQPTQDVEELGIGEVTQQVSEVEATERDMTELDAIDPNVEELQPGETDISEVGVPDMTREGFGDLGIRAEQIGLTRDQQFVDKDEDQLTIIDPEDISAPEAVEQDPPSVRERQRRDDLVAFERDFETGSGAVVGRDATTDDLPATDEVGGELFGRDETGLTGTTESLVEIGPDGGVESGVAAFERDFDTQTDQLLGEAEEPEFDISDSERDVLVDDVDTDPVTGTDSAFDLTGVSSPTDVDTTGGIDTGIDTTTATDTDQDTGTDSTIDTTTITVPDVAVPTDTITPTETLTPTQTTPVTQTGTPGRPPFRPGRPTTPPPIRPPDISAPDVSPMVDDRRRRRVGERQFELELEDPDFLGGDGIDIDDIDPLE